MSTSQQDIRTLFLAMLGREPDAAANEDFGRFENIEAVAGAILGSPEFNKRHQLDKSSPFYHYASVFDAQDLIRKYALPDPSARPGLLVNFAGVAMRPEYVPGVLDGTHGQVQSLPIPANWHADIAEWGAVLRSIDLARKNFTIAELGCGWGCWINNACVIAKRAGLKVHGIGVEGDREHIGFAIEACSLNGLEPDEITLHHAIASGKDGYALFPKQDKAGGSWGLEAVFDATSEQRTKAVRAGTHTELKTMSLETVSQGKRIDLLHIDIQGAEVDVVRNSLDFLGDRVAYIMIGTHSRQIEGQLMDVLLGKGWMLEIERPAIYKLGKKPLLVVDGVQGWRNPALLPSASRIFGR